MNTDASRLSAKVKSNVTRSNYSIHEIEVNGVAIREYVATSGQVFGIAWNGITHPDLAPLLGSYAKEYGVALIEYNDKYQKSTSKVGLGRSLGRRRTSSINTGNIIVEKWGHMRNMQGRAYIPLRLPEGLLSTEIK